MRFSVVYLQNKRSNTDASYRGILFDDGASETNAYRYGAHLFWGSEGIADKMKSVRLAVLRLSVLP